MQMRREDLTILVWVSFMISLDLIFIVIHLTGDANRTTKLWLR
jgi:hypothetical protein